LKSILKGATEDQEQPSTIEEIMAAPVPRTNPVNLIFVLSQYAPKISELHFFPPRDFFDLVMRSNLSSRSRATAFLWLMWWYLESDFSKKAAEENPFGPGQFGPADDPATAEFPIKCPAFDFLTPEQELAENVDTNDEKNFGEIKRKERIAILASDMAPVVTGPKRTNKKVFNQNPVFSVVADDGASTPGRDRQSTPNGSVKGRGKLNKSMLERDYPSDTDRTRSVSPPAKATPNMRINTLLNDEAPMSTPAPSKGSGRGNWSRTKTGTGGPRSFRSKLDANASQDGQSPSGNAPTFSGPHGFYLPLNGSDPAHKRTRPLTQHQLAVEQYRRRRVDVILDRGLRLEYKAASRRRRKANSFMRAWIRCKGMADGYDTDEDNNDPGHNGDEHGTSTPPPMPAGLVPLNFGGEVNDHGEEAYYRAKMVGRALRRLDRWENGKSGASSRTRGQRYAEDMDERSDDEDEDMMDVEEERRDEMDSDEDDEDMERYEPNPNALPPLSRVGV
jgi:Ino eighty subunit 1